MIHFDFPYNVVFQLMMLVVDIMLMRWSRAWENQFRISRLAILWRTFVSRDVPPSVERLCMWHVWAAFAALDVCWALTDLLRGVALS